MKRPIRETERARKVACASRDDEKKTIDGRGFRSVTGGGTTGQRRRGCAGGSRARETREKSRRDARARGEREPSTACSSRLSRFTGRPRTPRLEGTSFRGAGPRGIGGGGNAPHDVRVDAPGRTQHQVELRLVGLHHRDARAVTHRALSPPREAAVSRLPRRATPKALVSSQRARREKKAKIKPTSDDARRSTFETSTRAVLHRTCQPRGPQKDATRGGMAPVPSPPRRVGEALSGA